LLVERSSSLSSLFAGLLVSEGFHVHLLSEPEEIQSHARDICPDAILLGPGSVTRERLEDVALEVRSWSRTVALLLVTRESSEDLAIAALRSGINGYVKLPSSGEELLHAIRRCLPSALREPGKKKPSFAVLPTNEADEAIQKKIIGESAAIR